MSKVSVIALVVLVSVVLSGSALVVSANNSTNTNVVPTVANRPGDNVSMIDIWQRVTVKNVSSDGASLEIVMEDYVQTLAVKDTVLRKRVLGLTSGDMIDAKIDNINGNPELIAMKIPVVLVTVYHRVIAYLLSFVVLLLVTLVLTKGKFFSFIQGTDGRYSNSKFQLAIWFGAFVWTYVTAIMLRVWGSNWNLDMLGGLSVQPNILMLSGLSGLTFGAAKAITAKKVEAIIKDTGMDPKMVTPTPEASGRRPVQKPAEPHFPSDLVLDDKGNADLGDLQMIVISLIAVSIYFLSVYHFLGTLELVKNVVLPDVDTALLTSFGLGQGAYLIKKSAGKPGEA